MIEADKAGETDDVKFLLAEIKKPEGSTDKAAMPKSKNIRLCRTTNTSARYYARTVTRQRLTADQLFQEKTKTPYSRRYVAT